MRWRRIVAGQHCRQAANQQRKVRQIGSKLLAADPVHLSILLPTNRHGPVALSRIAQACSWAGPNVEIVVRDNSGNAEKRDLLAHFRREHCNIVLADPCQPLENYSEILRLAKGDFIFCISDDDQCFDRAIKALPGVIDQSVNDPSVIGVTGTYALESSRGSSLATYKDLDSDDPATRIAGFLSYGGPNVLFYSVLRREVAERILAFMKTMPVYLSFHDQILSLLYLLSGKYVRLPRLFYVYDVSVWETDESSQKRDLDFLKAANLDPSTNMLQWFLCGFEGAVLARNSDIFPDHALAKRQAVANLWFSTMFDRFKAHRRLTFGSAFAQQAEQLSAKMQKTSAQVSFQRMLADICEVLALSSERQAQSYFQFWNAALHARKPLRQAANA